MIVQFTGFDGENLIGYVTRGNPDKGGLVTVCTKPGEYYTIGACEVSKIA